MKRMKRTAKQVRGPAVVGMNSARGIRLKFLTRRQKRLDTNSLISDIIYLDLGFIFELNLMLA